MKRKKMKKSILAEGEVTGHTHRMSDSVDIYELENGVKEFDTAKTEIIEHEEHGFLSLPAGKYASDVCREVDPFTEEIRRVAD
jgi:hypothetical protein